MHHQYSRLCSASTILTSIGHSKQDQVIGRVQATGKRDDIASIEVKKDRDKEKSLSDVGGAMEQIRRQRDLRTSLLLG